MQDTTISLCMIVKNEEKVLARCLDSVADLVDEIIIVDTGSTDATKEIASRYTDQVYDFAWQDDFAAARNFSFSKATKDYIYVPDADEILDEENRKAFRQLKQVLLPEVEIVQMLYHTVTEYNTVLNAEKEYRPKLFKRERSFTWIDPVHETVRLDPVVFDSDIVITHMPQNLHSKRDFSIFQKALIRDGRLSDKLLRMYAMELYKTGDAADLLEACPYFSGIYETESDPDQHAYAAAILLRAYRMAGNELAFFKVALKEMAGTPSSEVCVELGEFYLEKMDAKEASLWFYNAVYEAEAILDVNAGGEHARQRLVTSYEAVLGQKLSEDERDYFMEALLQARQALGEI